MWQDVFDIYKSVNSKDGDKRQNNKPVSSSQNTQKAIQSKTMFIVAYLGEAPVNTKKVSVEERLAVMEMRQHELDHRMTEIEARINDIEDYLDTLGDN